MKATTRRLRNSFKPTRVESTTQIRGDSNWQAARDGKPKHVEQMSQQDKDDFKKMLDGKFPPDPAIVEEAAKARKGA